MFNCIIVEDEPLAAELLIKYVNQTDILNFKGNFQNAIDAKSYLSNNSIDIIFLDIQLPGIKGIELLDILERKYFIILTTAYSDYALKGFEKGVIDYLLKPILYSRFKMAVDRIVDLTLLNKKASKTLVIQINKTKVKIFEHKVTYIESNKGYVNIYDKDENIYRTKMSTLAILEILSNDFIRIHKSYIVNKKLITSYSSSVLVLQDSLSLPIGRTFKEEVLTSISAQF